MTADELAGLSERAASLLSGGGGLKALAQLLCEATGGAVLIEDDQWRHLALAEPKGALEPLPPSFLPFYQKAGVKAAKNGLVVQAAISDSLQGFCAHMPGQGDSNAVPGYVTLFVRGKSRTDVAPALRITASAAAVDHLRRGSVPSQARRLFWERFLSGEFSDSSDVKQEAAAAGVPLPAALLAAVFDVEGIAPPAARDLITHALAATEALCPLSPAAGQVITLFPIRHQVDIARARQAAAHVVRELPSQRSARSVNCGIGSFHKELLHVPVSLREAREALSLGRRLFGAGAVAVYPDLGIFALLHGGGDRAAFASFAAALIEPLAVYDRRHKTDLLKTLQLYLEAGENVKVAAERLSVHRHTIFYRLNQISQILKVDLKTTKDQLSLRAAIAIRQMNAPEEPQ